MSVDHGGESNRYGRYGMGVDLHRGEVEADDNGQRMVRIRKQRLLEATLDLLESDVSSNECE